MLFLAIYDALAAHRRWWGAALVALVALMAALALHIDYEEDIARFLPADPEREAYQAAVEALSNQRRIAIVFRGERDSVKMAMDAFEVHFAEADTARVVTDLQVTVDETRLLDVLSFVSRNAPYYLCTADYARMDSLLAQPDFIARQLNADKQLLMLPTGGMATQTITSDPLQLFTPLVSRLQQTAANSRFTIDDGYIFTAENPQQSNQSPLPLGGVGGGSCALAFLSSPYGMSESARNAGLAAIIDTVIARTAAEVPGVRVSAVGGPLIAVSNATQMKRDSMLAVGISVALILTLLVWHYRRLQDLLWIAAALGFGWLTAVAGMALLRGSMSVIVLGIGSVIIGIAVNYPLHFLDHLRETGDSRQALSDMVHPLLVGNITTVSAFLCLLWVDAAAMRDLGLFGALMLVGTILFVLVVMPLVLRGKGKVKSEKFATARSLSHHSPLTTHHSPLTTHLSPLTSHLSPLIIILTLFLAYFSLQTSFDADLHHINYMTDGQREDMALLSQLSEDVPADALAMIPTAAEQQERLKLWDDFRRRHADLTVALQAETVSQGFAADAFAPFVALMSATPQEQPSAYFAPVAQFIGGQHLINAPNVGAQLVEILQRNFNYVSFVCGFVVFAFLWLSFRRIELALLAFLPLAVGWVWILGLMELLGIQFNIVNIILATFIFGQGDDYTIFITEGLIYEHTTGRRRLQSYRRSIMLSAALMFIGMGTLIVARHPALRSLGEVTIIGMGVVVFMANYLPPLVFRWLAGGGLLAGGRLPRTLGRLGRSLFAMGFFLGMMYLFLLPFTWLYFHLGTMTEERRLTYHRLLQRLAHFIIHHVPGVTFHLDNSVGENFQRPAVIISNHQSHLDLMCLMMLTPRLVFLTNDRVWHNPIYGMVIHKAEFLPVSDGIEQCMNRLRNLYRRGYSICVFPEGTRSADCSILRFHQGAFYIADLLGADLLPVYIHGAGHVLPKCDFLLRKGRIDVEVGKRLPAANRQASQATLRERTRQMRHHYQEHYRQMCLRIETASYWEPYRRLASYYCAPQPGKVSRWQVTCLLALIPIMGSAVSQVDLPDGQRHGGKEMQGSHHSPKTAVIVCPGGSYFWLDTTVEGDSVASSLRQAGIDAYVLRYRTAGIVPFITHSRLLFPGHQHPMPLDDVQQEILRLRRLGRYERIGVMGFSAGGHLALSAACFGRDSLRPDFVAACYPVVTMSADCVHKRSRRGLLGEWRKSSRRMRDSLSVERHVWAQMPPVFLMNCVDDPVVDYRNAVLMDSALTANGVPHSYVQYKTGGHGFGTTWSKTSKEAANWLRKFLDWVTTYCASRTSHFDSYQDNF